MGLANIGSTLESTPAGRDTLLCVLARLRDLQEQINPESRNGTRVYSKRIQFVIQDILDMKEVAWAKKSFKPSAKTKNEIRKEHERDSRPQKQRSFDQQTTYSQHMSSFGHLIQSCFRPFCLFTAPGGRFFRCPWT